MPTSQRFSRQKAFNTAYRGIIAQGKQCTYQGKCRYRFRGLKCAVGMLIPDSKYNPRWDRAEGGVTPDMDTDNPLVKELHGVLGVQTQEDAVFLGALQSAHDRVYPTTGPDFVAEFKTRAQRVAQEYGLNVPQL